MARRSRRRFLQASLAGLTAVLAGCGMPGGEGEENGGEEGEDGGGEGGDEEGNDEEEDDEEEGRVAPPDPSA